MSKELKSFMSSKKFLWTFLTGACVFLIVVLIVNAIRGMDVSYVGFVIFIVGALLSLIPQFKSKKFYAELTQNSQLPEIEEDFKNAACVRNDTLRLGKKWIFIKGQENILAYNEIQQIYQYVHKTNLVEDERKLIYVNASGKKKTLCKLEVRGKSNDELVSIINYILSKNPNIKIGYH